MSKTDIGIDLGTANTVITLGKKVSCSVNPLPLPITLGRKKFSQWESAPIR